MQPEPDEESYEWLLKSVTAGYGEHIALQDIDLRIRPNATTVIMGPGGSGKTTLLRLLHDEGQPATPWSEGEIRSAGSRTAFLPQIPRPAVDRGEPIGLDPQQRLGDALEVLDQGEETVLLDEPAEHLEPEERDRFAAVIDRYRGQRTLVCVTHHLGFARRIADHVILLADGRLVEEAPVRSFFEHPAMQRTQEYLITGS